MNRDAARTIGVVFIIITVLTGLIWFNNIMVARQWNPKAGHEDVYHGPISWFDRFAVDFSTATTFIPFFGSLLIMVGFFRISRAEENSNVSEYFPFFKSYIPITVALGLIGTVWGLIMIGYYPPKTVKMEQLILCLRTALYSTLIALIWVFLFVLPIRYLMQRAYRYVSGYIDPQGTENILSLLKNLSLAVSTTTESLTETSDTFKEFNKQVSGTKAKFGEVDKVLTEVKEKVNGMFDKGQQVLSQMHSECQIWQKAAEKQQQVAEEQQGVAKELKNLLQGFSEELDNERKRRNEAEQRVSKAEHERDDAINKHRRFVDLVKKAVESKSE